MSKIKCNCPCHSDPNFKHVKACCVGGYVEFPESGLFSKIVAAQVGTVDQSNLIDEHIKEYFTRWPNYKDKLTYLEWYHLFLDFLDKVPTVAPHPGETPQKAVDFVWTDELVKIFALQEINVYKNFDRAQLDHWMDRFKNQQPTETPAPGEIGMDMAKHEKGDVMGLAKEEFDALQTDKGWHCHCGHFQKEGMYCDECGDDDISSREDEEMNSQQGGMPEEAMRWIDTVSDAYGRTNIYSFPWPKSEDFDPVTNQSVPYKDGAIAMYHRNQEQIKALQSEIAEYRKVLEEIRGCYPAPIALSKNVLDKYPSGSNI